MTRWVLIAVALAAAIVSSGCATTPPPAPQASASPTECKSVAVYSARDEIRYQGRQGVPGSDIAKAEGNAEAGRIEGMTPRNRAGGPVANTAGQMVREC